MAKKTNNAQSAEITLQISNISLTVQPVSAQTVARANARIQQKVNPVFHAIKKARRAAAKVAAELVVNH